MSTMVKMSKFGKYVRINPKNPKNIERSSNGIGWSSCYTGGASKEGDFLSLLEDGDNILAQTTKGLYISRNCGGGWTKRG